MTDPEKAEYENVIRLLTAKVEELLTANERLTSELTAHQTLRALYSDSTQPAMVRLRAAQAALNIESPALKPVEQPLDLVAEPPIPPLAEVVEKQRRRIAEMEREGPYDIEVSPSGAVRILPKPGSNGSGE